MVSTHLGRHTSSRPIPRRADARRPPTPPRRENVVASCSQTERPRPRPPCPTCLPRAMPCFGLPFPGPCLALPVLACPGPAWLGLAWPGLADLAPNHRGRRPQVTSLGDVLGSGEGPSAREANARLHVPLPSMQSETGTPDAGAGGSGAVYAHYGLATYRCPTSNLNKRAAT